MNDPIQLRPGVIRAPYVVTFSGGLDGSFLNATDYDNPSTVVQGQARFNSDKLTGWVIFDGGPYGGYTPVAISNSIANFIKNRLVTPLYVLLPTLNCQGNTVKIYAVTTPVDSSKLCFNNQPALGPLLYTVTQPTFLNGVVDSDLFFAIPIFSMQSLYYGLAIQSDAVSPDFNIINSVWLLGS